MLAAAHAAVDGAARYPHRGLPLLTALAERHGVGLEQAVVGNGADALIGHVCSTFLGPGDEAVVAAPSFVTYALDVRHAGAEVVPVPVRADGVPDLPAMARAVGPRTRVVFACSPNNPTGGLCPPDEVAALLAAVPRDVLVVLDEAYAEFVEPGAYHDGDALGRRHPNLLRLRTFSKIHALAGLRVGYALGDVDVVAALRRARHWFDVTDAGHAAATAALADPAAVARRRALAIERRDDLGALLVRHGLAPLPSAANFLAAPVDDADALADALARRGVHVRSAGGLLRVTVGDEAAHAHLDEALGPALAEAGAATA